MVDASFLKPRPVAPRTVIPLGPAALTWFGGWVLGMLIVAPLVLVAFGVEGSDYSIPELAVATAGAWALSLVALMVASRRYGTGHPMADFVEHFSLRFRPSDLVAAGAGVAAQLALIPLLYVPLREIWPDTFSKSKLDERASELADKADGFGVVLLVLVVVVGAPIVEELLYRGLLQRALTTLLGVWPGLVAASIWFALVHPSPIEYPGLLVAGLTFGGCLVVTHRLGAAMIAHAAFNATALWVVLR